MRLGYARVSTQDQDAQAQLEALKDLLLILEKIEVCGADFQSVTEAIDTSTPGGRMMMQIVGSFAEFERAMLK